MKKQVYLLVLIASLSSFFAQAFDKSTVSDTRTINKSFDVNKDAWVFLNARESEVNISTWSQNKVEVKVTLFVEAYDKEDMEKMFEEMRVLIEGSPDKVSIQSKLEISSVVSFGNRQRIRTKNNGTLKVKNYSFAYEIKMPASNNLNLKNRFGPVNLGAHAAKLDMELYECSFSGMAVSLQGAVLNLRFSKGSMGKLGVANIQLYESDIKASQVEQLTLNAKFSDFEVPKAKDVELTAYESDVRIAELTNLSGTHNFGSLDVSKAWQVNMKTYELKLNIGKVDKLGLTDSKFSKITCGEINTFSGTRLYEDNFTIGSLNTGKADSKFTNFKIGTLKEHFESEGYETDLGVGELQSGFKMLKFSGKFCNAQVNLPSNANFQLMADVKFGSVNYPESKLERLSYQKHSNGFNLKARTKGYSGSTLIDFSGYECTLDLNF